MRSFAFLVVILCIANALWSAWKLDWTYDEGNHLNWSVKILETGEMKRETVSALSTMPITFLNALPFEVLTRWGVSNDRLLRFAARCPTLLWLLFLFFTAFCFAKNHLSPRAAPLALILLALDPNLTAHGSLVTVDVPFAAVALAFLGSVFHWKKKQTLLSAATVGIWLGIAFSTKYTAFLLILPVAATLLFMIPQLGMMAFAQGAIAVGACTLTLCAGFGFREIGVPLAQLDLHSFFFEKIPSPLSHLLLPLPAAFIIGLDRLAQLERNAQWNVVILGHYFTSGVWYYFPILLLVKSTFATLGAYVVGFGTLAKRNVLYSVNPVRFLFLSFLGLFFYFCFFFRTQVGIRYILVCIPLATLLAAEGLARIQLKPLLALFLVVFAIGENLYYFGNPLAFTNSILLSKKYAYRWFADSNIDWGQNYSTTREELNRRHLAQNLNPLHILPGPNVFTVNTVAGVWWNYDQHRWLRAHVEPKEHINHTHLLFEITPQLFERFLTDERELVAAPKTLKTCRQTTSFNLDEKSDQPLSFTEDHALICLENAEKRDVEFLGEKGRAVLGIYRGENGCEGESLEQGKQAWYRLLPGVHAFCLRPDPGFQGRWKTASIR